MADRQRSFADMFPDLMGSLTQGAQWKRAMKPSTEKERDRQLTPEDRKWLKERRMQDWLDKQGNLLSPQDPAIAPQVLDYMMSIDPRRSMMKGFQKFILPKLSKMTRRRQKRQMKDRAEMRPSDEQVMELAQPSVESLEAHEQVSDRMGYNPTDWYVGEPRSPEDHSQDLAGRFLQFLRDKDARAIETIRETRPDPDRDMANLPDYLRWVAEQGEEESRRRETGLPPIRRRDPERFEQVDKAMRKRYESLNKAVRDRLPADFQSSGAGDVGSTPPQSWLDLMGRTMGRKLSRDKPSTNR